MSCQWGYDCFRCGAPDCIATGQELVRHDREVSELDPVIAEKRKRNRERNRIYYALHREECNARSRDLRRRQRAELREKRKLHEGGKEWQRNS